jgi:hypothetical protein
MGQSALRALVRVRPVDNLVRNNVQTRAMGGLITLQGCLVFIPRTDDVYHTQTN